MWKLSITQKDAAVARYEQGESSLAIAASCGVSCPAILGVLRRRGVRIRDCVSARRKHHHREDAFERRTAESDYWCGFLFADGTIVRRTGSPEVAVVLCEKDRQHLVRLRSFLRSTHALTPIASRRAFGHINGVGPAVRYSIRSRRLAAALSSLGMARKSLDRTAAESVAVSRDFWRGVVDGDGYVGISRGKPRLELVGGRTLLTQFLAFLQSNGIGNDVHVRPHKTIFCAGLAGSSAQAAVALLYKGSRVSLPRKHRASLNILALGRSAGALASTRSRLL